MDDDKPRPLMDGFDASFHPCHLTENPCRAALMKQHRTALKTPLSFTRLITAPDHCLRKPHLLTSAPVRSNEHMTPNKSNDDSTGYSSSNSSSAATSPSSPTSSRDGGGSSVLTRSTCQQECRPSLQSQPSSDERAAEIQSIVRPASSSSLRDGAWKIIRAPTRQSVCYRRRTVKQQQQLSDKPNYVRVDEHMRVTPLIPIMPPMQPPMMPTMLDTRTSTSSIGTMSYTSELAQQRVSACSLPSQRDSAYCDDAAQHMVDGQTALIRVLPTTSSLFFSDHTVKISEFVKHRTHSYDPTRLQHDGAYVDHRGEVDGPTPLFVAPKCSGTPLTTPQKLAAAISELVVTERTYVKDVCAMLHVYLLPLSHRFFERDPEFGALTRSVEAVLHFQQKFLSSVQAAIDRNPTFATSYTRVSEFRDLLFHLAAAFRSYANEFKLYSNFAARYSKCLARLKPNGPQSPNGLASFLESCNPTHEHSKSIESYMIKPIQRVLRYPLIIEQMKLFANGGNNTSTTGQNTSSAERPPSPTGRNCDKESVREMNDALTVMNMVAEHINEMQKISDEFGDIFDAVARSANEVRQYDADIDETEEVELNICDLLMYGHVDWHDAPTRFGKIKKGREYYSICFVFNCGVVLLTKDRVKQRKGASSSQNGGVPNAASANGSGDSNDTENGAEVIKFKTFIPLESLSLALDYDRDSAGNKVLDWKVIHRLSKTDLPKQVKPRQGSRHQSATSCADVVYNLANTCLQNKMEFVTTLRNLIMLKQQQIQHRQQKHRPPTAGVRPNAVTTKSKNDVDDGHIVSSRPPAHPGMNRQSAAVVSQVDNISDDTCANSRSSGDSPRSSGVYHQPGTSTSGGSVDGHSTGSHAALLSSSPNYENVHEHHSQAANLNQQSRTVVNGVRNRDSTLSADSCGDSNSSSGVSNGSNIKFSRTSSNDAYRYHLSSGAGSKQTTLHEHLIQTTDEFDPRHATNCRVSVAGAPPTKHLPSRSPVWKPRGTTHPPPPPPPPPTVESRRAVTEAVAKQSSRHLHAIPHLQAQMNGRTARQRLVSDL